MVVEKVEAALRTFWPKHPDGQVQLGPNWIPQLAEVAVEAVLSTLEDIAIAARIRQRLAEDDGTRHTLEEVMDAMLHPEHLATGGVISKEAAQEIGRSIGRHSCVIEPPAQRDGTGA